MALNFIKKKRKKEEIKPKEISYEDKYANEDDTKNDNEIENINVNNNNDDDLEEEEDIVPTFVQENNNCIQAIAEKEAFLSCPYFHLVILLTAPLIFTILVILMFQISLSSAAATKEETFSNILVGESLANHSLFLLNSTFNVLEKRTGISDRRSEYYNPSRISDYERWKREFKQVLLKEKFIENFQYFSNDQPGSKKVNEIKKSFNKLYKSFSINQRNHRSSENGTSSGKETIDCHDEILSDLKDLDSFH
ncbi:hypothetical protein M9Y10_002253 [Tritrichomonas musculus]|uniref:Uncharacterized protein n=1 Tax=Tritrichomonas musculus TaxID=1915356 RepID=A0ABR2LC06_9EUKA